MSIGVVNVSPDRLGNAVTLHENFENKPVLVNGTPSR